MKRALANRFSLFVFSEQTVLAKAIPACKQSSPPLLIKHESAVGTIHA